MRGLIIVLLFCFCSSQLLFANDESTSLEDETTPMEQADQTTLDELVEPTIPIEDEPTPMEQGDMKSIDEINRSTELRD